MPRKKSKYLEPEFLGKILSVFSEDRGLSFSEIHSKLVELGIVRNKDSRIITSRILKLLREVKYIEQGKDGKYYLVKSPKAFSALTYVNKLAQESETVERDMDSTRLCLIGLDRKLSEEDFKKISRWSYWGYYVLIKGKLGDAPENNPESLYFLLGLIDAAYACLRMRLRQGKLAIVLTPASTVVDPVEFAKSLIKNAKGPYSLASSLSHVDHDTAILVLNAPWLKRMFPEDVIVRAKELYPLFKQASELEEFILWIYGRFVVDLTHAPNSFIDEFKRNMMDKFRKATSMDPTLLGKIVGLIVGTGNYTRFLKALMDKFYFEPSREWVEEFVKGFHIGREIYKKLEEESSEKVSLEDLRKDISELLGLAKEFNLSPLNIAMDIAFSWNLYLAPDNILEEVAREKGLSKEWIEELKFYRKLLVLARLSREALREEDEEEKEAILRHIKEHSWKDVALALAFWPLGEREPEEIANTLKALGINNFSMEELAGVLEEARKLQEKYRGELAKWIAELKSVI